MQKIFGRNPAGKKLEIISRSPNYKQGSFKNIHNTPVMLAGTSYWQITKDFFNKPANVSPKKILPSIKTNLQNINDDEPVIIWFGHSSYLIKHNGINILVDPVFSGNASPLPFFIKAFAGSNIYTPADFNFIDILVITHDHYDHLDYKTIIALAGKVGIVYTALGVGAHLQYWGMPQNKIVEFDWWQQQQYNQHIFFTAAPARHFSGRGFTRGKTLWASFILQLHQYQIYIGGDSGYDNHFTTIGKQYGPFDIALLEAGQYGKNWPYIHMTPEETVQAATDLKATVLMPVHWAKFALAFHTWSEPVEKVTQAAKKIALQITTPIIGEPVILNKNYPTHAWWHL
jgi:L-ascorbate metabolism protein UlaG (beta-lactamase superfamily)